MKGLKGKMKMKRIALLGLIVLVFSLLFVRQTVSAHESITIGKYTVEIGWIDEPPVVGQRNAVVVNVTSTDGSIKPEDIKISALQVAVSYGPDTKTLTLQPLGEDTPGQYIAPILPMTPGKYTVLLSGKIDDTDAKASVQPEEVVAADTLQFPTSASDMSKPIQAPAFGLAGWLGVAGVVFGLAGLAVGLVAMNKKK